MTSGPLARHYNDYWTQSVVQAVTAETLAEYSQGSQQSEYFLAGLLCDLGRLAMLKTIGEDYLPVLEAATEGQQGLCQLEQEMISLDHVEVGVRLMENWNLPEALVAGVRMHHAPADQLQDEAGEGEDAQLIVAVAVAAAVGDYFCSECKGPALERLRELTTRFYAFDETKLDDFLARTRERIGQAGDMFRVNVGDIGDPTDLMALANEHLAQLAMREHVANTQATAQRDEAERQKIELASQNEQLQKRVLHDPLTKIYTRQFFDETLTKEVSRSARYGSSIGVLFADVDRFKQLNDNYGHQFGDEVLIRVADTISEALRSSDLLARYGGEEFVVLAIEPTEKGLHKVAERIRERIESEVIEFQGQPISVTISIGAVHALPGRRDVDFDKRLVAEADAAMYDSKENGRNQVHLRSLLNESERLLAQKTTARRFSRWLARSHVLDIPTVSKVLLQYENQHVRIGVLSQNAGFLDAGQVDRTLQDQEQTGDRFGETAIRLGLLTDDQVAHLLAVQQENPEALSNMFVTQGLVDQQTMSNLLNDYQTETAGLKRPATASSAQTATA